MANEFVKRTLSWKEYQAGKQSIIQAARIEGARARRKLERSRAVSEKRKLSKAATSTLEQDEIDFDYGLTVAWKAVRAIQDREKRRQQRLLEQRNFTKIISEEERRIRYINRLLAKRERSKAKAAQASEERRRASEGRKKERESSAIRRRLREAERERRLAQEAPEWALELIGKEVKFQGRYAAHVGLLSGTVLSIKRMAKPGDFKALIQIEGGAKKYISINNILC